MADPRLDPLEGAIGGITGRDGRYPLKDRRREQGYDVDTEVEPLEGTTEGAPKELSGDGPGMRDLTDPPGQPIADAPEDYEAPIARYVPPKGVSSFQTPDHLVGAEVEADTMPEKQAKEHVETVPIEGQQPPPAEGEDDASPWANYTRHEQLDSFIDTPAENLTRPDNWMGMTVADKKKWLDENA